MKNTMNSQISAVHYCLPSERLTNEDLAKRFGEKTVASISRMSGIVERRVARPGVTAADLAVCAAERLLQEKKIERDKIDLLVFASQTPDYQIPATSCIIHNRLRLRQSCASFDINLGCSAYPYTLAVAHGLLVSGAARTALVLNADTISHVLHPGDRSLVTLHGDAAAATLLESTNEPDVGFVGFHFGTDGAGAKHILIPASGTRSPRGEVDAVETTDDNGNISSPHHLQMNGAAVFHFSLYKVPVVIREALDKYRLRIDDLDLVLLHQANRTMDDMIYKALKVPLEKQFYFIEKVGNAAGASTPMLLAEAWRQGRLRPGSKCLIAAFGNGLSWGITIIQWPGVLGQAVQAAVDYIE